MKRVSLAMAFACCVVVSWAEPSFGFGLGARFFKYSSALLDTGLRMMVPLSDGLEFDSGVSFALAKREDSADIVIPLDVGLNFLFGSGDVEFVFGAGISAQPVAMPSAALYVGPFARGGVRVRVHPHLALFVETDQELLFGAPEWIAVSGVLRGGIIFSLGAK